MKKSKARGIAIWRSILFLLFVTGGVDAQPVGRTVFVSVNGNDQNEGTLQHPVKTIQGAVNKLAAVDHDSGKILFLPGVYHISQTTLLGQASKLRGDIEIAAFEKGKVVFSAGIELERRGFLPLSKDSVKARVSREAARNIIVCNILKQSGGNIPPLDGRSFGDEFSAVSPELFEDSIPMRLARWPNDTLLKIRDVNVPGDNRGSGEDRREIAGLPQFTFEERQHRPWKKTNDIWINGYLSNQWSYSNVKVDSISEADNFVRLNEKVRYGVFSNKDQSTPDIARASSSRGFYFYNVLEELDQPGEWYLDRKTGDLYIWPKSGASSFTLTNFVNPILKLDNARNVSIKDIMFQYTRGKAIEIQNSQNVDISNCNFFGIGLQAITVSKSDHVTIDKCRIQETGGGGIILNGGDRRTLTSGYNVVSNSEISRYSRVYRSYAPAISIFGVGTTIDNCFIHDAPDQAIVFTGNNHILQNNIITNVCKEFGDMGAVYTGRDPASTGTVIRNNIFENIRNKRSGMVAAVYLDDGIEGIRLVSNLFYKCGSSGNDGFGAIMIHGGGFNVLESSIFVECGRGVSNTPWTDDRWKKTFLLNRDNVRLVTEVVDIRSKAYTESYKHLRNFFDADTLVKRVNSIRNSIWVNVAVPCSGNGLEERNSVKLQRNFRGVGALEWALFSDEKSKLISRGQDFKPIDLGKIKLRGNYGDDVLITGLGKYFSRTK